MNEYYLIQRLELRDEPGSKKGVDRLVAHDYMGSAEFEFGAIPAEWKKFRENVPLLRADAVNVLGQTVHFIAHKSITTESIKAELEKLFQDKTHTKENTYMPERLKKSTNSYYQRTVAWLRVTRYGLPLFWTINPELQKKMTEELGVRSVSNKYKRAVVKLLSCLHQLKGSRS